MQEPSEPLNRQSASQDEPQADEPVAIPHDGLASNGEAPPVTGNTETTFTLGLEKRHSSDETSKPGLAASEAAVIVPQEEIPPQTLERTPVSDLIRRGSDRRIAVALMTPHQDGSVDGIVGTELKHNGRWYRVPRMPPAVARSLILPSLPLPCGSARKLFDSILALLQEHVRLPRKECSIITHWSMATWFPDFLPFLPSLALTGPASAADLLLRTLVAVCRRPVLLAEVSPAVLRALPLGELMPTLLIREPQLSKSMAALLDASNQPGYLVRCGKDFQQFYCAKCIYIGEQAKNQLFTSNSVHIHVGGNSLKSFHSLPTDQVIQDFQNRLYNYRIFNHAMVATSNFRVCGFRPEVCAMGQVLGAPIADDPELQQGIIALLKERDEQSRVDRATGENGIILKAVLRHCHQSDQQKVFVREIADTATRIYSEEGESLKISNETVGHVLKNLGLYTRRLGNAGRGLMLDKDTQSRAHELSYANEVLPDSAEVPVCAYCHKLQLLQTQAVV